MRSLLYPEPVLYRYRLFFFLRLLSRPRFRPVAWSCGCVVGFGWL